MEEKSYNNLKLLVSDRFPDGDVETLLELLAEYGTEAYEREPARVRAAIVMLSRGDPDRLVQLIAAAKADFRDVLYWLELESGRED